MSKKPNIVFILTDDQGAWALNCAGNPDIITPNIDKLANNGVRFENFFCGSPVCSPARACLVTGEMPSAHGVHDWLSGGNADTQNYPYMKEHGHFKSVDKGIEYLAGHPSYIDELEKIGYNCGLSGKWHLGNNDHAKSGFSKWFTIYGGGCEYFKADTFENGKFNIESRYVTDVITDKAIDYIDEFSKEDKPFYLSVHYTAPHSPWTEANHPKALLDLYKDCKFEYTPKTEIHKEQINTCPVGDTEEHWRENLTGYYAAITGVDNSVGRIMDKLISLNIDQDTIVIYTADNGMNLGQHGIWGKGNGTYPPNMYDTSVKVPLIVAGKGIKKDYVETELISACDIFPTLLDIAGEKNYEPQEKQCGKSFGDLLFKNSNKCVNPNGDIFICDEYGFVRMMRTKARKFIYCTDGVHLAYYNLEKDPNEEVNEIFNPRYVDEIKQMRDKLVKWFETYSIEKNNGLNLPVTGKGQRDLCYKDNAFDHDMFYFRNRNKCK